MVNKNIFKGLARRGWPGLAFYVQVSFLSCHQRDFPYDFTRLRRPRRLPKAALRAACLSGGKVPLQNEGSLAQGS